MGVERQKGFKVEYCHVNDEYVAMLKDTPFMGVASTIDEAIAQLETDIARGDNDDESPEASPDTQAPATADAAPADYASLGGDDDDEGDDEDGDEAEAEDEDAEGDDDAEDEEDEEGDDEDRNTPPA